MFGRKERAPRGGALFSNQPLIEKGDSSQKQVSTIRQRQVQNGDDRDADETGKQLHGQAQSAKQVSIKHMHQIDAKTCVRNSVQEGCNLFVDPLLQATAESKNHTGIQEHTDGHTLQRGRVKAAVTGRQQNRYKEE